jgi:TRAP-type C4-dicarboxylate transport system permease small subunit
MAMSLGQEREAARAASSGADAAGGFVKALTWLIQAASVLSCLIILAAFGIILYAVAMRYFVGTPINWSDELNGYLIVAMVMFGIG